MGLQYITSCGGSSLSDHNINFMYLPFSPRRGRHIVAPCVSVGKTIDEYKSIKPPQGGGTLKSLLNFTL